MNCVRDAGLHHMPGSFMQAAFSISSEAKVSGKDSNGGVSQIYENTSVNSNNFISFCHKQAVNVPYPGEICPTHVTIKCQQGV